MFVSFFNAAKVCLTHVAQVTKLLQNDYKASGTGCGFPQKHPPATVGSKSHPKSHNTFIRFSEWDNPYPLALFLGATTLTETTETALTKKDRYARGLFLLLAQNTQSKAKTLSLGPTCAFLTLQPALSGFPLIGRPANRYNPCRLENGLSS